MRSALHLASIALVALTVAILAGMSVSGGAVDQPANVSLYVTDDESFAIEDAETAIENGTLETANETFFGEDTLVVELESETLAAELDERNGTSDERFFDALAGNLTFSLVQSNPRPMLVPMGIDVGPDNATVHRNGTTTYIAIETAETDLHWEGGSAVPDPEINGWETFAVRFGYDMDDSFGYTGPETEFHPTGAEFSSLRLDPLAPELVNETVAVFTEPEDELVVRATIDNGTVMNATVTDVDWTGGWGYSLDFRQLEAGTEYTLELVYDGEVVDEQNGTIQELEATLRDGEVEVEHIPADYTHSVDRVGWLNVTAELSHGGRVMVYDETGERLGSWSVSPAEETNLSRTLTEREMVDLDPDELSIEAVRRTGEGNVPYPGANLTLDVSEYDWGSIGATPTPTPGSGTPTPTPGDVTPTPDERTPTPDPTPTQWPSETPTPTPDDDLYGDVNGDGDGPGFTLVATGLALLAIVLAGLRRSR